MQSQLLCGCCAVVVIKLDNPSSAFNRPRAEHTYATLYNKTVTTKTTTNNTLKPHLLESIDDARPRHQVCIGDMAPVSNPVDASLILVHHCVADVSKLAVLKDEEVVLLGNRLQLVGYADVPPEHSTAQHGVAQQARGKWQAQSNQSGLFIV
jgi:hypothetical protein